MSRIAASARALLKNGGRLCVVYPAPRAFEMMTAMQQNHLAPKRVRTVHGVEGRAPKFVLLEGVKLGGEGLHWMEPLVLRDADGSFSREWHRIYDPAPPRATPAAAPHERPEKEEER